MKVYVISHGENYEGGKVIGVCRTPAGVETIITSYIADDYASWGPNALDTYPKVEWKQVGPAEWRNGWDNYIEAEEWEVGS